MLWKEAALAVAGFAVALALSELAVRSLPQTALGFRYEGDVFYRPTEFEAHFDFNRFVSHDIEYGPKPTGTRRVLLLGDSFVQGLSVEIPETLPRQLFDQLERRAPGVYDVVALAGAGFGPREERNLLARHGGELEPDFVINVFFGENDVIVGSPELVRERRAQLQALARETEPNMFRIHADDARVFFVRTSHLNRWISHRLTLANLRREREEIPTDYAVWNTAPSTAWEEAWSALASHYLATRQLAASLGADYGVVAATSVWSIRGEAGLEELMAVYPSMRNHSWDLDLAEERLATWCRENEIPFLALLAEFRRESPESWRRFHWRYDGHWNAAGNTFAGSRIAEFIVAVDAGRSR